MRRTGDPRTANSVVLQIVDALRFVTTAPTGLTGAIAEPLGHAPTGTTATAGLHDDRHGHSAENAGKEGAFSAPGASADHNFAGIMSAVGVLLQHVHHSIDHPAIGDIGVEFLQTVKSANAAFEPTAERQTLAALGNDAARKVQGGDLSAAGDAGRKLSSSAAHFTADGNITAVNRAGYLITISGNRPVKIFGGHRQNFFAAALPLLFGINGCSIVERKWVGQFNAGIRQRVGVR